VRSRILRGGPWVILERSSVRNQSDSEVKDENKGYRTYNMSTSGMLATRAVIWYGIISTFK
jgi:hypothetical protein